MNKRSIVALMIALGVAPACSKDTDDKSPTEVVPGETTAEAVNNSCPPGAAKGTPAHIKQVTSRVDDQAIVSNALTTNDWLTTGLDFEETHHSKLRQITPQNVKNLGLVWSYDLEALHGVEATPVVVDGIMYVSSDWSVVHAVDARTGKRLWKYDPKVPRDAAIKGCCDVVNRGVAVYKGKVYVGAFDGRLIALDAATGNVVWEKDTIADKSKPYTITGAPRVFKGKVIIGNGGSEYGVRGYVTAYDAETGAQKWRWFTVPGDPSKPFENAAMEKAAKTWDKAGKWWINGGGGTAWDSMVYDADLNRIYIGVGNAGPWSQKRRSPGGGDNLYTASIVALNPDTGEYVWHYQETPGDNSDYTSAQHIILADLRVRGELKKVILHAPKNGFFFVIDRATGKLISAKNYVDVNWATGYDANGRPIETTLARPDTKFERIPGVLGAHNWMPMSYNPQTGLVYIPAQHIPIDLQDDKEWTYNVPLPGRIGSGTGWNTGHIAGSGTAAPFGRLIAWNPATQKEVWRQEHVSPWNGGTLTTAGNLVFQGTADGRFVAYNAATGEKLWESPTGVGVIAAPVTYSVDGKQYVSIAVGWGGNHGLYSRATNAAQAGTVFTFALNGKAPLPEFAAYRMEQLLSGVKYNAADAPEGRGLYVSYCLVCHGVPGVDRGGAARNLAYVGPGTINNLDSIIKGGAFTALGMPNFTGKLTTAQVEKIKAFIQATADSIRAQATKPADAGTPQATDAGAAK